MKKLEFLVGNWEGEAWTINPGNGFKIRYTITLSDAGQWIEKGEWSRDGENWSQFFGMTLDKVK